MERATFIVGISFLLWATVDRQVNKARFADATTIRTTCTRGAYRPGPRTINGVLYADQKVGAIMFHKDVRQLDDKHKNSKIPDSDPRISYKNGKRYFTKGRYWLVVKSTNKKVWEAPIYTNGNLGFKNVTRKTWKHYFALRPKEVSLDQLVNAHPELQDFLNQSTSHKTFEIDWMKEDHHSMKGRKMRKTMIVHFTETHERSIEQEDVVLVGAMADADSAKACAKAEPFVNS